MVKNLVPKYKILMGQILEMNGQKYSFWCALKLKFLEIRNSKTFPKILYISLILWHKSMVKFYKNQSL